jgi:phosphatidylethanolamine-binding protein (PEBP) family uncharacterized protein
MKHIFRHRQSWLPVILFATALLILRRNDAMAMTLHSDAFKQNDHIPSKYTCEGEHVSPPLAWQGVPNGTKSSVSPPLAWQGVPNGTKSFVLIIEDPDAPDPKAPKMVWVHWVIYNIPPSAKSLPENVGKARLPQGTLPN